jgi:hypothetical protein
MRASGVRPSCLRRLRGSDHERGCAVVDAGRVSGRDRAALAEGGLEPGQGLQRRVLARRFVHRERHRLALLGGDGHGQDLVLELARLDGGDGLAMALQRERVLLLARHAVRLGHDLAAAAHVVVLVGLPQAVVHHRVDQLAVAEAHPFPRLGQEVGRVGHGLHSARDHDVGVAGRDALRGEHHRLEAGPADLVDGERADLVGEAALQRRLPRGCLAEPRGQDVAHDDFVHAAGVDARALDGLAHDHGAELGRAEALSARP